MLAEHRLARRFIAPNGEAFEVDPPSMPNGVYRLFAQPDTMLREVLTTSVNPSVFGDVPPFTDFAEALLTLDPQLRPTAEEAAVHPWLARTGRMGM